jgi:hypothetical protein
MDFMWHLFTELAVSKLFCFNVTSWEPFQYQGRHGLRVIIVFVSRINIQQNINIILFNFPLCCKSEHL